MYSSACFVNEFEEQRERESLKASMMSIDNQSSSLRRGSEETHDINEPMKFSRSSLLQTQGIL